MITPGDTVRILAKISAYDQRTVGDSDIAAWTEALNLADPTIGRDDALTAVAHWHAQATEGRIRPAHVIQGAQAIARRRAGQTRAAELAALEPPRGPVTDRSTDVADLLAHLRNRLGPSDPAVLRRREWVDLERRRQRTERAASEPNPSYTGPPPPGGYPVPDTA